MLHEQFTRIASRIKELPQSDELVIAAVDLPDIPAQLSTEKLIVRKCVHSYNSNMRIDSVYFFAQRALYLDFALGILCTIFKPNQQSIELKLTNPHTEIHKIIIEKPPLSYHHSGINRFAQDFCYSFNELDNNPLATFGDKDRHELPCFDLDNEHGATVTEKDWADRNILKGFGSLEGCASLARVLLDFSNSKNTRPEINFETILEGFIGTASGSIEARFNLPEYLGWLPEYGNLN